MKKFRFLLPIFLIFFSVFVSFFEAYAATIRINTPKVLLELEPGQTYAGEIVAENPTDEATKCRIYLEDWVYAPGGTGEKRFSPVGSTLTSAGKWITFSPVEEELKPFGRTTVHYTVTVPMDVKGAYYAVLFFETLLGTALNEEGASVNVAGRIGALFFIEIKGTNVRKGEIQSVEITPPFENKPLTMLSIFHNSGNVDITVGGNFLILDQGGRIKARGDLNKIYTFPGATESSKTEWIGRLPKGAYQALLTYNLGKGQNLVEEKTFTVD